MADSDVTEEDLEALPLVLEVTVLVVIIALTSSLWQLTRPHWQKSL